MQPVQDQVDAVPELIADTSLPLRRRDLPATTVWKPAVSTDTPTLATAGPGGASGVTAAVAVPYNTPKVTRLCCLPVQVNSLGTDYQQNQVSGSTGSGATPWALEFDYYGADFAVKFRNAVGNSSVFWVWVDGRPLTAAPQVSTANGANSQFWYRVTFSSSATHRRIRIYMAGADFGGLTIGPTDSVSATKKPAKSLAILGGSWENGAGAHNQLGSPVLLGIMLGVELFHAGYGSSGYTVANGFAVYGSPTRINPSAPSSPTTCSSRARATTTARRPLRSVPPLQRATPPSTLPAPTPRCGCALSRPRAAAPRAQL